MTLRGKIITLLAAVVFPACTQLPVDGPAHRDIASGAAATLVTGRSAIVDDYALIDISDIVLDCLADIGPDSFFRTFGAGQEPAPLIRIGVGDVLQVAIFESAAGGLFIPAEAGVRPGNFVTLPSQTVSRAGTISVPYAGAIKAAGRTTPEIERDIESKLASRAIEPQAVVTVVEQNATEVAVIGDGLIGATKFRIKYSGETILDMISRAGGLKYPGYELFVTLQRNKRRATVPFPTLVNDPKENIFVGPGDTIYVYREQQKFTAVGALAGLGVPFQSSGLTGLFSFEQERLTLNEAIAKAGGLLDTRADPAQVFLYRTEYRGALERMGADLSKFPPDQKLIPTVYRANFRDPSSFFYAQRFPMRHRDTIYAANSDATEVVKFLDYLRAVTSTVAGVG